MPKDTRITISSIVFEKLDDDRTMDGNIKKPWNVELLELLDSKHKLTRLEEMLACGRRCDEWK